MNLEQMKVAALLVGLVSPTPMLDKIRAGGFSRGRMRTMDGTAFPFRMGTGFAGDVNRGHPQADLEPAQNDPASGNPVLAYGLGCLVNTALNTVRSVLSRDSAITKLFGVIARPFPIQQQSASNYGAIGFGGTQAPPAGGQVSVLKKGYIIVNLNGAAAVTKGGLVYVYYGASTTGHVQGGFEGASGANLINLDATGDSIYWNGPAGPDGLAEMRFSA